jgi:preprotein translocase subunit YajC
VPALAHLSAFVVAADTSKSKGGSGATSLIFLAILLVGGYLLLVRPARMRQRKAVETRRGVEPGVEVITTAGLVATVVEADDDTVVLEIAPGVHSRFLKGAIARVNTPAEPDPEPDAGSADDSPTETPHS